MESKETWKQYLPALALIILTQMPREVWRFLIFDLTDVNVTEIVNKLNRTDKNILIIMYGHLNETS